MNDIFNKISPLWKQLFIIDTDIANTDYVNYDLWHKSIVMSTSGLIRNTNKIELKMLPDINNQIVFSLIKNLLAIDYNHVPQKFYIWNGESNYYKSISKELKDLLKSNGILLTQQADPEFCGIIAGNSKGYGAFLLRNSIK